MKKLFLLLVFVAALIYTGHTQQQTFDLTTYTPPAGWQKIINEGVVTYAISDLTTKNWCTINILKSDISKGNVDADFDSEWDRLAVVPFKLTDKPTYGPTEEMNGWKLKAGGGVYPFNESKATFMLVTYSGFDHCASILVIANNKDYVKYVQDFLGTVQLTNPAASNTKINSPLNEHNSPKASNSMYSFSTTNWDNGWTSIEKDDWVEVSKGNIKILLHYPNQITTRYYANSDEEIAAVWNSLVAPRYSNISDFKKWFNLSNIPRPLLASAYLQDNATGKKVYVSIYHRGASNIAWMEVICPDQKSFIETFGLDIGSLPYAYVDPAKFNALDIMPGYNRFAVSMQDLAGTWTSDYSSSLNYYNNNTGLKTGTRTYASSQIYAINSNGTYRWELNTAESSGSTDFRQTVSTGTCNMITNWQINFSDIGKKPKTYNCYFSCVKGARLLWLQDKEYGEYNSFAKKVNQ